MICSTLASLWKFQYFQRPIYNPVEHLWCSLYYQNSNPLSIFTKKVPPRCSFGFYICLCFSKTLQTFYFFKVFYIIRLLKCVIIFLKYFASFNSSNMLLKKISFPCSNARDVFVKFYITYIIITSIVFYSQLGDLLSILIVILT